MVAPPGQERGVRAGRSQTTLSVVNGNISSTTMTVGEQQQQRSEGQRNNIRGSATVISTTAVPEHEGGPENGAGNVSPRDCDSRGFPGVEDAVGGSGVEGRSRKAGASEGGVAYVPQSSHRGDGAGGDSDGRGIGSLPVESGCYDDDFDDFCDESSSQGEDGADEPDERERVEKKNVAAAAAGGMGKVASANTSEAEACTSTVCTALQRKECRVLFPHRGGVFFFTLGPPLALLCAPSRKYYVVNSYLTKESND